MNIQVLGSGCPTCKKLFELTKDAVKQLNRTDTVEYVTDISRLVEMGVMSSPVLAIDGKVAVAGSVPDIEKIKQILTDQKDCCQNEKKKTSCKCGGMC